MIICPSKIGLSNNLSKLKSLWKKNKSLAKQLSFAFYGSFPKQPSKLNGTSYVTLMVSESIWVIID